MIFMLFAACSGGTDLSLHESAADSGSALSRCGDDAIRGLDVGQCAPEFTLPDRDDVPFALSSLRGKVALVDISAIW